MSDNNIANIDNPGSPGFLARVVQNDAARKGFAAGLAGLLVAVVTETLWPSE